MVKISPMSLVWHVMANVVSTLVGVQVLASACGLHHHQSQKQTRPISLLQILIGQQLYCPSVKRLVTDLILQQKKLFEDGSWTYQFEFLRDLGSTELFIIIMEVELSWESTFM
ncbi:hypothetical protein K504DRAFT_508418 [Pleomassaria siparia CBS 279.74]|uniref:Uncharacterized protein n=1 Tax=Pleomassaria siparia CBS 279.74 TaxID=1314801 RepID=A0A6G1JS66_9PLEO|nr:hypothetical protein K504DRAFT_508418 [Pleomassaria siparia CBS 279.74]